MSAQSQSWSGVVVFAELVVGALLGIAILPWIFGDDSALAAFTSTPVREGGWLGLALLLIAWILILSISAMRILTQLISQLPETREHRGHARPEIVAALFVATLDIVVVNAIVRLPLSVVLAWHISPATAESTVGVVAVALLLGVLVRLHFVARPYVEGSAWSALDVVVATTSSEGLATTSLLLSNTTRAAPPGPPATHAEIELETIAATRLADLTSSETRARASFGDAPTRLYPTSDTVTSEVTRPNA